MNCSLWTKNCPFLRLTDRPFSPMMDSKLPRFFVFAENSPITTLSLVIVERLESFEIVLVHSKHFGSQSPSQRPNDRGFLLRGTHFNSGFIVQTRSYKSFH